MEGWIKLHKKIQKWRWWDDAVTLKVFLYLLLNVNYSDKRWMGIIVKRGQIVASVSSIAEKARLSNQTVRTNLNRLKSTNEITIKSTNKFSIITISNYDDYQIDDDDINKQINKQPNKRTTNEQQTNNNNIRKEKNNKNKENTNVPSSEESENGTTVVKKYDYLKEFPVLLLEVEITTQIKELKKYRAMRFAKYMQEELLKFNPDNRHVKNAKTLNWVKPLMLMEEIDKRSWKDILEVFLFVIADDPAPTGFSWVSVIQSPDNFREKFDKIKSKMISKQRAKESTEVPTMKKPPMLRYNPKEDGPKRKA